jgi:PadR family transcriptional regulator AphA
VSPRVQVPLSIEIGLLGFLRRRPMHGYEIHRELSVRTGLGSVWRLKQSHLYALLARLEEEGYVHVTIEPQDARPPRKVFELTEFGIGLFLDWVQNPVDRPRRLRMEFLVKLYFAYQEGPELAQRLIERQRDACLRWLRAEAMASDNTCPAHSFAGMICGFRRGQLGAMLAWLDECTGFLPALHSGGLSSWRLRSVSGRTQ